MSNNLARYSGPWTLIISGFHTWNIWTLTRSLTTKAGPYSCGKSSFWPGLCVVGGVRPQRPSLGQPLSSSVSMPAKAPAPWPEQVSAGGTAPLAARLTVTEESVTQLSLLDMQRSSCGNVRMPSILLVLRWYWWECGRRGPGSVCWEAGPL